MTVKDAVKLLNEQVQKMELPEGIVARVVLLIRHESEFMSEDDLNKIDEIRGEKLNLAHADSWKPETLTRDEADLIRRGVDVYRDVLWSVHGEKIMQELIKSLGERTLDDENE